MKALKFPNLDAIMAGAVSGHFTEWPMVRVELANLITEFEAEAAALAATACEKPQSDERGHTFCAKDVEIARLRTYVEELRQVVFDVVKWNEAYKEPLLGPIALIDRARAALAKNPDLRLQSGKKLTPTCERCWVQNDTQPPEDERVIIEHEDGERRMAVWTGFSWKCEGEANFHRIVRWARLTSCHQVNCQRSMTCVDDLLLSQIRAFLWNRNDAPAVGPVPSGHELHSKLFDILNGPRSRPVVTKAPPYCACPGPWCEGRDRDTSVQCLGFQIDPDGGAEPFTPALEGAHAKGVEDGKKAGWREAKVEVRWGRSIMPFYVGVVLGTTAGYLRLINDPHWAAVIMSLFFGVLIGSALWPFRKMPAGSRYNDAQLDPESPLYIGHTEALERGWAKCICHRGSHAVIHCPFHGR